jgi:transmembrane sensor
VLTVRRVVAGQLALETQLGDARVRLSPNTVALLHEQGEQGALVVLERGDADFSVPSRKGRAPFAVQAGAVRVEVVGTRFHVTRRAARVEVADEEGRVRVLVGKESRLLNPGESWNNGQAESAPVKIEPVQPASSASAAASGVPTQTGQAVPGAGARSTVTRVAKAPSQEDARARFEQAARLEASNPEQALRGYAELASGRGPWAETALYALGRLALERGDRARAAPLLHSYLRRYPRGANAPDVRDLLAQLGVPNDEVEQQ